MDSSQLAAYVAVLSILAGLFKLNVGSEELSQFLSATVSLVSLGIIWYKRYKDGNLTLSGFPKKAKRK